MIFISPCLIVRNVRRQEHRLLLLNAGAALQNGRLLFRGDHSGLVFVLHVRAPTIAHALMLKLEIVRVAFLGSIGTTTPTEDPHCPPPNPYRPSRPPAPSAPSRTSPMRSFESASSGRSSRARSASGAPNASAFPLRCAETPLLPLLSARCCRPA